MLYAQGIGADVSGVDEDRAMEPCVERFRLPQPVLFLTHRAPFVPFSGLQNWLQGSNVNNA